MANKELFTRSATELLILSVLSEQDMYTYQIGQEIKKRSEGLFCLSDGVLYAILYKLAKENYLSEWTQEVKRSIRVYYHLEETGRLYYEQCLEEYRKTSRCLNKLLDIGEDCL